MIVRYLLLSLLFILLAYFIFRKVVRKDYRKRQRLSAISYLLETFVFGAHANFIYLALPAAWPSFPPFPDDKLRMISAGILFGCGVVLLLCAWFKLGTRRSFGMDRNKLVTTGLYRFSRNPQLLGYGLLLAGVTVVYFSWMVFAWFLLYIIASAFMIQSEEEFLKQKYRGEYEEYCKRVPRIIGYRKTKK
ncbi:MAG: isoprenylcysteine carboxylmethyltransferase family protein [Marinifilaceae bacterium]